MTTLELYFATNRKHQGDDRWHPTGYGTTFSDDGMENLRFGWLQVDVDQKTIDACLRRDVGFGTGDGEKLADYLSGRAESARIEAYAEKLRTDTAEVHQPNARLGSRAMFKDLSADMQKATDVLVYVHGFNVSWQDAVGSALALQCMLNKEGVGDPEQKCAVVLFSWPSDGKALPLVSYKSDRSDAQGSGYAFGRALLKVRDFLAALRDKTRDGSPPCGQDVHLLCHSMGNWVLQNALARIAQFTTGPALPRLFEHIFLCAPDVDDNVLEPEQPMDRLHELARSVTVYHNRGDLAMHVSDYTKGNPDRLGMLGAAHPNLLHNKVHQVDCSPIVGGVVEHSYYMSGVVNGDILLSIDGEPQDAASRRRRRSPTQANVWVMDRV